MVVYFYTMKKDSNFMKIDCDKCRFISKILISLANKLMLLIKD